jgi:hypothetical protein
MKNSTKDLFNSSDSEFELYYFQNRENDIDKIDHYLKQTLSIEETVKAVQGFVSKDVIFEKPSLLQTLQRKPLFTARYPSLMERKLLTCSLLPQEIEKGMFGIAASEISEIVKTHGYTVRKELDPDYSKNDKKIAKISKKSKENIESLKTLLGKRSFKAAKGLPVFKLSRRERRRNKRDI